ncbi:hypothetical protein K2X05_07420 [bacterium]|nr:hypothetical protein [bacterium]
MKISDFSYRLFSFFLCKNAIHAPPGIISWIQINLGDWTLFIPQNTHYKNIQSSEFNITLFIGDVFHLNEQNLEESEGHYIAFLFDQTECSLKIFRNKNSHIGIYYFEKSETTFICSDFLWAHSNLPLPWTLDSSSIEDFFECGLITNGKTLFTNVQQLPFQKQILCQKNSLQILSEPSISLDRKIFEDPANIYEFLIERIQIWLRHCRFHSIALSGGADSRLIFAALYSTKDIHHMPIHSRLHPNLTELQDADFVIAQSICKKIGLEHKVQKAQTHPSAYLSQDPPAKPPVFSALYGGEYLGGEVLNLISRNAHTKNSNSSVFANSIHLLAQSFTCDFYGGAWFPVFAHHNLTLTPFWDSKIIQFFLSIEAENIKNYNLYNQILKNLPKELLSFPFQSQLTDYHPHWQMPSPPLLNPKSLSSSEVKINPNIYDFIQNKGHKNDSVFKNRIHTFQSLLQTFKIIGA